MDRKLCSQVSDRDHVLLLYLPISDDFTNLLDNNDDLLTFRGELHRILNKVDEQLLCAHSISINIGASFTAKIILKLDGHLHDFSLEFEHV